MSHYVCSECKGQSDTPKVCGTENCTKKGQDLQACDCTDGQHGPAQAQSSTTPADN